MRSPELERLLDVARRDGPSAEAKARMASAIAARVAAAPAPAPAAMTLAPVIKVVIGVVFIAAVGAAILWASARAPGSLAPVPEPVRSAPAPSSAAPTAVIPTSTVPVIAAPSPSVEPRRDPPAPRPARSTLEAEVAQLERVRKALSSGDAPQALALLEQYTRTFPRGVLREESAGLGVQALCRAGRGDEAIRAARALIASSPGSLAKAAIRSSCAAESLDAPDAGGDKR